MPGGAEGGTEMRPGQRKTLRAVLRHLGVSASSLAMELNTVRSTIGQHLTNLCRDGYIVRGGTKKVPLYFASRRTVERYEASLPLRKRYAKAIERLDAILDFETDNAVWLFKFLWGPETGSGTPYHMMVCGGSGARRLPTRMIFESPFELWRLQSRVDAVELLLRWPPSFIRDLAAGPPRYLLVAQGKRPIQAREPVDMVMAEIA